MNRLAFAASFLAVACATPADSADTAGDTAADTGDSGADTADSAEDSGDTDTGGCSGTAPVVEELSAAEGDPMDDDGTQVPTVLFTVGFSDADGDANVVSVRAWFDEGLDGVVDSTGAPVSEAGPVEMTLDGAPVPDCEGAGGALRFALGINGAEIPTATEVEFAVAVADKAGLWSAPELVQITTPAPL